MSNNDAISTTRSGTPFRKRVVVDEAAEGRDSEAVENLVIPDQEFEALAEAERLEELARAQGVHEQQLTDAREQRQQDIRMQMEHRMRLQEEIAMLEQQTMKVARDLEGAEHERRMGKPHVRQQEAEEDAEAYYTPRARADEQPTYDVMPTRAVRRDMPQPPNPRLVREHQRQRVPASKERAGKTWTENQDSDDDVEEVQRVSSRPGELSFRTSARVPVSQVGGRSRLARVDFPTFEGSPQEDPSRFLSEFELAAIAAQLEEDVMISTMAAQSLKGGAKSWFLAMVGPSVRDFCQDVSFARFLKMFRREFLVAAPNDVARQKRAELVQDGSVEAFVVEWRRLDAQLSGSSTDEDRKFMFLGKLKADVRTFVSSSNPVNLSAAVSAAMRYSTENEVTVCKRGTVKTTQIHSLEISDQLAMLFDSKMAELNAFQRASQAGRGGKRPFPMDLYKRGLCFKCQESGHQAKDCPKSSFGRGAGGKGGAYKST